MPERPLRPDPAGFTLVEILVTVVVIAMGCLAALWMQSAAMRGHAQSNHLTAASSLAESEIERLRSLAFAVLTEEVNTHGQDGYIQENLNRQGQVKEDGGRGPWPYTRTTRYFGQPPTSRIYQVEVEVTWRDSSGGRDRKLVYAAALTDFSPSD